jgi:hypothetical protein
MSILTNRIEGAAWHKDVSKYRVLLVGAGATGSMAGFYLSRLGISHITIVDFDTFDYHNCHTQLASYQDVGQNKADVLSRFLLQYVPKSNVMTFNSSIEECVEDDYFDPGSFDIIVCAADKMSVRQYCFDLFKECGTSLFIDPRIAAEFLEIYSVCQENPSNWGKYEERLFSDEEGTVGACNYQQSTHCAGIAGGLIAQLVTNYATEKMLDDYAIPLKLTYDLRSITFTHDY